ncbi:hypothetical protein Kisp01_03930 [Kineosporia sp. NBRC 101677]|nr:hypothetical protein Kisp01_03930 [Kineosporia sp. NBRC 101677]
MGVVHLGLDPNGKAVAVKVLRPHVAGDPDARRRLAREVATLRRVRHPRVAGVLDADVESDVPYIVTSFVPGKTLEKHVRDHGPLPRGHVARIGKVMADALRTVHSAGVVHRDVKPANVMLLDGEPVLIDFGIAHAADESRITHTGLVMGTPGYLSPEIIGGDPVSSATDWWGWGATLAYAATGRPPFGTGPIEVVLDRVRRGATDLDGVDEGLRSTLTAALSVDPRVRPHPEELIAGLAAPAPARPTTGPQPQIPAWGTGGAYVSPDEETIRTPGPGEEIRKQVKPTDSTEIRLPSPDEVATMRTPPPSFADAKTSVIPPESMGGSNAPTHVIPPPSGRANAPTSVIPPANGGNNDPTSVIPPYNPAGNNAATSVIPPANGSGPKATRRFDPPGKNGQNGQNQQQYQPPGHGYQHQPGQPGPANGFEARPGQQPARSDDFRRGSAPVLAKGRPIGDDPDRPQSHYDENEHRENVLERLPLGSMPLFLFGLLLALAGMAAVAPYGAVLVVGVGMVAARVVDRTNTALMQRRDVHGPRPSDGMVTVLSLPWRILGAVMSTVFALLLPLLIGVSVAFIAAAAQTGGAPSAANPGRPIPLALGMLALVLTAWWGPGGGPVRRGTEKVVSSITSGPQIRILGWAVLVLLLLSCVMILRDPGYDPDWGPLEGSTIVQQLTG